MKDWYNAVIRIRLFTFIMVTEILIINIYFCIRIQRFCIGNFKMPVLRKYGEKFPFFFSFLASFTVARTSKFDNLTEV